VSLEVILKLELENKFYIFSMCRVQQKISQGLEVLTFFTMREWDFESKKFQQVFGDLDEVDKEM
jgi:hypothetical protein